MATTSSAIADIADFVRIINEDPEWADAVRGVLLGQDLLDLPARFNEYMASFNEYVATLAESNRVARARFEVLEQRFDKLGNDLDAFKQETRTRFDKLENNLDAFKQETRTRFDKLENNLDAFKQETRMEFDKLKGAMGQLVGAELEHKIHANVITYVRRPLDLHGKTRILKSAVIPMQDELQEILFEAEDHNLSLAQIERIGLTDIVLAGQRQGSPVYVMIEISRTIANHDIARVADSARFLHTASGRTALPVVIGCYMADEQRQQAQRRNVAVRIVKDG